MPSRHTATLLVLALASCGANETQTPGEYVEDVVMEPIEGCTGRKYAIAVDDEVPPLESFTASEVASRFSNAFAEDIRKTLTPFLGLGNFQTSVAVRLNTDKKNIKEVIYDPESRVARSVRVVKEKDDVKNQTSTSAASYASTRRLVSYMA